MYAILDVELTSTRGLKPLDVVDAWLSAGVRLLQVRAKTLSGAAWVELLDAIMTRARPAGAIVLVNDRADIARMTGADGVHVGQDDLAPRDVRAVIGDAAVVGVSTHSEGQVEQACQEPVDYLAIGPIFETATKTAQWAPVGLAGIERAVQIAGRASRPVVAIGGITLARAPQAIRAGAAAVAVISDLLEGDIEARARAYLGALTL